MSIKKLRGKSAVILQNDPKRTTQPSATTTTTTTITSNTSTPILTKTTHVPQTSLLKIEPFVPSLMTTRLRKPIHRSYSTLSSSYFQQIINSKYHNNNNNNNNNNHYYHHRNDCGSNNNTPIGSGCKIKHYDRKLLIKQRSKSSLLSVTNLATSKVSNTKISQILTTNPTSNTTLLIGNSLINSSHGICKISRTQNEQDKLPDRINYDRRGLTSIPIFENEKNLRLLSLQHNLINVFHVPAAPPDDHHHDNIIVTTATTTTTNSNCNDNKTEPDGNSSSDNNLIPSKIIQHENILLQQLTASKIKNQQNSYKRNRQSNGLIVVNNKRGLVLTSSSATTASISSSSATTNSSSSLSTTTSASLQQLPVTVTTTTNNLSPLISSNFVTTTTTVVTNTTASISSAKQFVKTTFVHKSIILQQNNNVKTLRKSKSFISHYSKHLNHLKQNLQHPTKCSTTLNKNKIITTESVAAGATATAAVVLLLNNDINNGGVGGGNSDGNSPSPGTSDSNNYKLIDKTYIDKNHNQTSILPLNGHNNGVGNCITTTTTTSTQHLNNNSNLLTNNLILMQPSLSYGVIFQNLVFLDLYDNQIEKIINLDGFKSLTVLLLGKNRITDISGLASLKLTLRVLDLHGNKITNLTNKINCLQELKSLNLAGNQIRQINQNDFAGLMNLKELNLKRNKIKRVYGFDHLVNLERLWLCHNDLHKVDDMSSIAKAINLQEVTIENNPVSLAGDCVSFLVSYLPNLIMLSQMPITEQVRRAAMGWRKNKEISDSNYSNLTTDLFNSIRREEVISNARTNWELLRSQQMLTNNNTHHNKGTFLNHKSNLYGGSSTPSLKMVSENHEKYFVKEMTTTLNSTTTITTTTTTTAAAATTTTTSSSNTRNNCGSNKIKIPKINNHDKTENHMNNSSSTNTSTTTTSSNNTKEDFPDLFHLPPITHPYSTGSNPSSEKTHSSGSSLGPNIDSSSSCFSSDNEDKDYITSTNHPPPKRTYEKKSKIINRNSSSNNNQPSVNTIVVGPLHTSQINEQQPFKTEEVIFYETPSNCNYKEVIIIDETTKSNNTQQNPKNFNDNQTSGDKNQICCSNRTSATIIDANAVDNLQGNDNNNNGNVVNESHIQSDKNSNLSQPSNVKSGTEIILTSSSSSATGGGNGGLNTSLVQQQQQQSSTAGVQEKLPSGTLQKTHKINAGATNISNSSTTTLSGNNNTNNKRMHGNLMRTQTAKSTRTTNISSSSNLNHNFTANNNTTGSNNTALSNGCNGGNGSNGGSSSSSNRFSGTASTNNTITTTTTAAALPAAAATTAAASATTTKQVFEREREQGGDYLIEICGRYLNIYGMGALRFIDKQWNLQKAYDVNTLNFSYINFNNIATILCRIKLRFPNAESFVFRETNITCLGQLNALAELQGIQTLVIDSEGNTITTKEWRPYAIYRLSHWGLKTINGIEVTENEIDLAHMEYSGLSDLVLWSLPDTMLQPLLQRLRLDETCSASKLSAKDWLMKADQSLKIVVGKEALQWKKQSIGTASAINQDELNTRERGRTHFSAMIENTCNAVEKLQKLEILWPNLLFDIIKNTLLDYSQLDVYLKNLYADIMK